MIVERNAIKRLSWYWNNDQVLQRIEKNSHIKKIREDIRKERSKNMNKLRKIRRA